MQWLLAVVAAVGMGVSKAGLAGVSLLHVVIFAFLFGARTSTGVVLPMLLAGDVTAVAAFHQHARWDYIRRMMPPSCAGVVVAALVMGPSVAHVAAPADAPDVWPTPRLLQRLGRDVPLSGDVLVVADPDADAEKS